MGIAPNGDIIHMDAGGTLRRIDPSDGSTIQSSTGWGDGVGFRPAVGKDGLIYGRTRIYTPGEAFMSCYNADCTLRWQYSTGSWWSNGMMCAPSIGQDGTLYSSFRSLGICAWVDP